MCTCVFYLKILTIIFCVLGSDIEIDNSEDVPPVKIKRQSVSFAKVKENISETSPPTKDITEIKKSSDENPTSSSTHPPTDVKCIEKDKSSGTDTNGRYLMSGHAKTHTIVINLDDKSRFTDEITV